MDKDKLQELLKKYRAGTASAEEIRIIYSFYVHKAKRPAHALDEQGLDKHLDSLAKRLFPKTIKRFTIWKYVAAAAILICSSITIYPYLQRSLTEENKQASSRLFATIKPGHDQATLRLSDGRIIALGEQDKLINTNGTLKFGQDVLDLQANQNQLITLETPQGGQFQVQLEDGTKIWLNAGSTVTYPAKFSSQERLVTLKGEAYFEVAHNPNKPFKVHVNHDEIQVLGTGFNIQSYKENLTPVTTLIHGKVKVIRKTNVQDQSLILEPGQQTVANTNLQKAKIDINGIVAWKNGLFSFKRSSVKTIVSQLERWYNIEFVVDQAIAENRLITGEIPRNVNLDDVMQILAYFDIQGQMKNNKVYLTMK